VGRASPRAGRTHGTKPANLLGLSRTGPKPVSRPASQTGLTRLDWVGLGRRRDFILPQKSTKGERVSRSCSNLSCPFVFFCGHSHNWFDWVGLGRTSRLSEGAGIWASGQQRTFAETDVRASSVVCLRPKPQTPAPPSRGRICQRKSGGHKYRQCHAGCQTRPPNITIITNL